MKFNFVTAIVVCTLTLLLNSTSAPYAQEIIEVATDSAIVDPDIVKENVKKRIQEVIKGDTDISGVASSYAGTLSSLTDNTLTIATLDGTKLASTSASTTYITLPGNDPADIEDLTIDGYIAVLGFLNGSGVLDTLRIIIHEEEPEPPSQRSFFGQLSNYDEASDTITLKNPIDSQELEFELNRTTDIRSATPAGSTIKSTTAAVEIGNNALVIYDPEESPELPSVVTLLLGQTQDSSDYQVASKSANELPPELQP